MYKLKPNVPAFELVDGPFAGQKFEPGKEYSQIPENCRDKFVEVKKAKKKSKEDKK